MAEIALWKMLRCHHVVIKNKKITKWQLNQSPSAPNEQKKRDNQAAIEPGSHSSKETKRDNQTSSSTMPIVNSPIRLRG